MANWSSIFPGDELRDEVKDLEIESWLLLGSTIQRVETHAVKTVRLTCLLIVTISIFCIYSFHVISQCISF